MTTAHCLDRRYREHFKQFNDDPSHLTNFFLTTLEVPRFTWQHVVDEIRELTSSDSVDFDRLSVLYACFVDMGLSEVDIENLK
jgi:hypothetical protein